MPLETEREPVESAAGVVTVIDPPARLVRLVTETVPATEAFSTPPLMVSDEADRPAVAFSVPPLMVSAEAENPAAAPRVPLERTRLLYAAFDVVDVPVK